MASFNYQKICQDLVSQLPSKQRDVIERRFGLKSGERETLESIGKSYRICRERVRQIEKSSLNKIKKNTVVYKDVCKEFNRYLKNAGGIKEENSLLNELGEKQYQAQVYFLLTICGEFKRVSENDDFKALWAVNDTAVEEAKKIVKQVETELNEKREPMSLRNIALETGQKKQILESYLEISKRLQKNSEGFYGLREWPEINPKGIKDKIYLLFKKVRKPFHFTEVASQIPGSLVQTVHNELIRDPRFILIGRGIYALKEWGYISGDVKDVIANVLTSEARPMTKEEIIQKVLQQRQIKQNTILMNLSNKKYFVRDNEGKYWRAPIQEA